MADSSEIQVEVRFWTKEIGSVPAGVISGVLSKIDRVLYKSEIADLEYVFHEFKEIDEVTKDALRHRIQKYPPVALQIVSAQSGSIVLAGTVAAVALWILQQTLAETLKEAWLESDSHHRIKEFLLQRRGTKVRDVAEALNRARPRMPTKDRARVSIQARIEVRKTEVLVIEVHTSDVSLAPTGGDTHRRSGPSQAELT